MFTNQGHSSPDQFETKGFEQSHKISDVVQICKPVFFLFTFSDCFELISDF